MKKFLVPVLFVLTVTVSAAQSQKYTSDDFRRITAMTARVLERNHYSARPQMTESFSAQIFDNFIDALDPERLLFSAEDLAPYQSIRVRLGFMLSQGDCRVAFDIYNLYRTRYAEYRTFSQKFLAGKIDFTVDENYTFDRSKLPRPKSKQELAPLWRKKLKHQLLIYKLMESSEPKPAKKSAIPVPSPSARILHIQRDLGNAIQKRENIDILGILLNALASSYGAHSNYNAPKATEDFDIHMNLSLSGIGATLTSDNGYIKIVELVPGGPAARSGKIKVNDRLLRVTQENGESTDLIDMPVSQAVTFIRGEKGTKVTLDVLSGEAGSTTKVTLTRDKINLEDSAAKSEIKTVKDSKSGKTLKVGIINLPSFYMNFEEAARGNANARRASTDIKKILEKFNREKVDSVLIDLRRNGGGSLPDAVKLAGLFIKQGPVVQVRGNRGRAEVLADTDGKIAYSGPLVVLTSKLSASAAEIFSAALRDSRRAVMVGDSRTFGKSTVLNVHDLTPYNAFFKRINAGSLIFESAMFFRINGNSVQQLGVSPDILLPSLTEEMEIGEMFFDNHLPWDTTKAVKYTIYDNDMVRKIAILRKSSANRIKASKEYAKLLKYIAIYRKMRGRKTVSLNEEKRRKEYAEEKLMQEKNEETLDKSKSKSDNDPVLNEAVNIAAELSTL